MSNDLESDITQTCECGNDTYHVKMSLSAGKPTVWVECSKCGRPTQTVGDSLAQHIWQAKNRKDQQE